MDLKSRNITKIVRIVLVLFTIIFSINSFSLNYRQYSCQSDVLIFEVSETPSWEGYKENNFSSAFIAPKGFDEKFIFSIKTGNLYLLTSPTLDSYSEIFFLYSDLPPPHSHA